jgi:hypothetical protein
VLGLSLLLVITDTTLTGTTNLEIIFVLIFLYYSSIGIYISAMVTMATELCCLNKLLENLRYFRVVFFSVDLRVKRFNLTVRDTNSKCSSNFGNFS